MGTATTNKDLLNLEKKNPASFSLESTLLVCKQDSLSHPPKPNTGSGKLVTSSVPKSQVLGKLKDFLGVMAEANARLQDDAKEKSSMDYDIETLTGNETEVIEMDLVLGVADLHTAEAVAAAESAMAGSQSVPLVDVCGGDSDSDSSDEDDDSSDDDIDIDGDDNNNAKPCSSKLEESTPDKEVVLNSGQAKKRKKIIELQ